MGHKRTKWNICHHILTSSTQLQNRSFHVVERTRTSSKCQKMKNALAKRTVFHCQICKFVGFCCRSRRGCSRELKQTRRRRKRERHLKMSLRVSATIFQLFKLLMLEKCVLTILELNWNQRLGHKKTKFNICHHMLTSSTHLQNRSFHVVERTRTSTKCQKMKNARAKRAKILFFIVKYADLWGFCCRRRRGCLSSLVNENVTERIEHIIQKEEVTMKLKGQTPEETVYKHETQAFRN